ncbi:MAG: hypothetical protein ACE5JH_01400 [Acidobacteriota bacterium]
MFHVHGWDLPYVATVMGVKQGYPGRYATGDIASIDEKGYLPITDRVKDGVRSGGEWISPLVLEDIISRHEAVSEVATIRVPDERRGERPMALVVPRPERARDLTAEKIGGGARQGSCRARHDLAVGRAPPGPVR